MIDLVEIKLSMIMVTDSEARREQRQLERCLGALKAGSARRKTPLGAESMTA